MIKTGVLPLSRVMLLSGLLLAAFLLSLALGAVSLSPVRVLQALGGLFFPDSLVSADASLRQAAAIVNSIRLPRTLAALFAGAALAVSGAAVQGVFRNPLAGPDILGISAGSSFGAVLVIALGWSMRHPLVLPAAAFAGALAAVAFVYLIGSGRGRSHILFVILAGLAVSSLLNGMVSAVLLFSERYEMSLFLFWTMGGLEGVLPSRLSIPLPVIALGIFLISRYGRTLNLLALGDQQAHSLGVKVEESKLIILSLAALLTAMAIALAGPVGFVGLMVPHLIRMLWGPDHRSLVPLSALGGAFFLVFSDVLGRILIAPYEIKTGIITSLIGGPYFIFLILRYQRKGRLL